MLVPGSRAACPVGLVSGGWGQRGQGDYWQPAHTLLGTETWCTHCTLQTPGVHTAHYRHLVYTLRTTDTWCTHSALHTPGVHTPHTWCTHSTLQTPGVHTPHYRHLVYTLHTTHRGRLKDKGELSVTHSLGTQQHQGLF